MERKTLIICTVVGSLGLIAAVLGFAAEATRIKASQVTNVSPGVCTHPWSPAYGLGITAAVLLLVARIVIIYGSGCGFSHRNSDTSTNRYTLMAYSVLSWVSFLVAFLMLWGGADINHQRGYHKVYSRNLCYVKAGVFSVASILSIASVSLGILYYLTISSGKSINTALSGPNESGIAMGRPEVPPTSHDPVFVNEDTYMRRQV